MLHHTWPIDFVSHISKEKALMYFSNGCKYRVNSVSHPTEQALHVIYDNLQIATIDEKGDPNIQPVWFYFDEDEGKLLIITSKSAKKTQSEE